MSINEITHNIYYSVRYGFDVQELRIPAYGYFTNEVINSMAVLVFDPEANAAFIRKVVYEDCKDADEAIAEYEKEK